MVKIAHCAGDDYAGEESRGEDAARQGNFIHFLAARKGIKIWKRADQRKWLQHTPQHRLLSPLSSLSLLFTHPRFSLVFLRHFFAIFSQSLCGQEQTQGEPKEAYQSWLSWNILWQAAEPSRVELEKRFALWPQPQPQPVPVPDLGRKLRGFAPAVAAAFSSHFPVIITLINLLLLLLLGAKLQWK